MFKNALIIGASRGLGRACASYISAQVPGLETLTLVSRKTTLLEEVRDSVLKGRGGELSVPFKGTVEIVKSDLATPEGAFGLTVLLKTKPFDLVIYASGGGPHGEYVKKEWKDHLWSLQLGLLSPMQLSLEWLRTAPEISGRFVIVGSRIAEQNPDPLASSYAAGKHGLMGFVSSMQQELEKSAKKIWLFSPGYMDSEMLPATAKVRHDGSKLMSTETAAQALLRWIVKDGPWHRVLN